MTERDILTKDDLRDFTRWFKMLFTALLIIQAMAIIGLIEHLK